MRPLSLYTWQYNVEEGWDYLTVGGTQFRRASGPDGVKLSKGKAMLWYSDGSAVREGWKVCATKGPGQCSFHSHSDSHQRTHSQSLTRVRVRISVRLRVRVGVRVSVRVWVRFKVVVQAVG